MSKSIPFANRTIGEILAEIHAASRPEKIGVEFERLFLYAAPRIPDLEVKNIWTWADWPQREKRASFLDGADFGVDLVAELRDGKLVAVQCKCYAEERKVLKQDVVDFIAGAVKKHFDLLWIVAVNEYVSNAEKLIREHGIRIIDFRKYEKYELTSKKPPPRKPWKLQEAAIEAVLRGFAESGRDRGKMIMACGTGKTFTSLCIAEKLAPKKNAGILFIAPSIALVAQARQEWLLHTARPLACTVICSDSGAGRNRGEDISHTELSCRVTTKPAEIAEQLKKSAGNGARVVFCTYQSLNKLRDAQHKHGAPDFDLALVDEAHRTTGYLEGNRAGLFQLIHKPKEIRAKKRLYMTATPRVYDIKEKNRAENEARIVDMNDYETYGREFYRLSFRKAVGKDMLCDYKVIALGISEAAMTGDLSRRLLELNVEGAGRAADEQAILALGAIALAVNGAVRGENSPGVLARTIAYASNIRRSKWLARALDADEVKSWIGSAALPITAEHLDGTSSALKRGKELRALNAAKESAPRLISNAQLFTEGVDVPALNAVAFLDPRQSKVDTIQAVGRVMRRAEKKKFGYIVVPVILPPNADLLQVLEEDQARFKTLGNVLSALQSHDESLYTELTERLTFANINRDYEHDSDRPPQTDLQVQKSLLDEDAKQEIFAQIAKNTGIANRGKITADAITSAIEKAARIFANEGAAKIIASTIGTPSGNEAESCKTAALLIANACIMHKRLEETGNLGGLTGIESANLVKNPSSALGAAWRTILAKDYAPIFHDATALLEQLPANPRIENAVSILIQCAIDNAATLNEIGFDHAGPLYHRVLGSAQSDGAFYTKNLSAYLLAGLAFGKKFTDWKDAKCVEKLRVADPACGTGTLLMAALNIIKKRAANAQKSDEKGVEKLHKKLVENTLHGFDINRYSVQLAACNLTIGAPQTDYARMNLHALQHGPVPGMAGGTFKEVRHGALELLDDKSGFLGVKQPPPPLYGENPLREEREFTLPQKFDAVIYNPPFTDTQLQGGRFGAEAKKAMGDRLQYLKEMLGENEPNAATAIGKRSIQPYFTPLTNRILSEKGTLAKVIPATVCTAENARAQRKYIAANFHVEMVVTSHDPKGASFSENTAIHECLVVARRGGKRDAQTRFIQLARQPRNLKETEGLLAAIENAGENGLFSEMLWPAEKIREGDWTPMQWFNPKLFEAANSIDKMGALIQSEKITRWTHNEVAFRLTFDYSPGKNGNAFCTISEDLMQTISAKPESVATAKTGMKKRADSVRQGASNLLVATRFRTTTSRVSAVYSETPALGSALRPIPVQDKNAAKVYAAFFNSSFGVIQLLNRRTKTLTYPAYDVGQMKTLRLPDPSRADFAPLLHAFEEVKNTPLKRLAECATDPSRKTLDHAAARAIGMQPRETDQWREWLAAEPTITNKPAVQTET